MNATIERRPVAVLSFATLRTVNATRTLRWHKSVLHEWSLADWVVAAGGEIGEALDVVKKLNRDRDGQPGNMKSSLHLLNDLSDELADSVIYLDTVLSSQRQEPLGVLWSWPEFGSLRWGTETEFAGGRGALQSSDHGAELLSAAGKLATAAIEDPDEVGGAADEVLKAIDAVACHYGIDLGAAVIRKFNATSESYGFPERLAAEVDDDAQGYCEACAKSIYVGDYMFGGETSLCGDCAPNFQALLDEPDGFVDGEGDQLTPEACRAWFDEHIAAGGKATDSMATLVEDLRKHGHASETIPDASHSYGLELPAVKS